MPCGQVHFEIGQSFTSNGNATMLASLSETADDAGLPLYVSEIERRQLRYPHSGCVHELKERSITDSNVILDRGLGKEAI